MYPSPIKIQNEQIVPIVENQINMYVCGVTVYDDCHLGHARTFASFDVVQRYLRYKGIQLKYVRNITDIDDKIIKRAHELQISTSALTKKYIQEMHTDFAALNIMPPDVEPKATEHIPDIIALIQRLIDTGHAYVSTAGDVLFSVQSIQSYGELSSQRVQKLVHGTRHIVQSNKMDEHDFVLWKLAKPGEPSWGSPWGAGRPGWHIECSAMSAKHLGPQFDIHGGGMDLKFPHHENERAQSLAAHGVECANYWMHTGMVLVDSVKMSKSLGNFCTIKDALAKHHPETLRYFLVHSQYRTNLDYTDANLELAKNSVLRLYTALRSHSPVQPSSDTIMHQMHTMYREKFIRAMDDDFNTPAAIAVLFEIVHQIHIAQDTASAAQLAMVLRELSSVLGLLSTPVHEFFTGTGSENSALDSTKIEELILMRNIARKDRDFECADSIRSTLLSQGIVLEDTVAGTIWRTV